MHKIYSKKRLLIPKIKVIYNKRKLNKKIYISIIFIIAITTATIIFKVINPIFESISRERAKILAIQISNEETLNIMKEYSYQDLFTVEKDKNDNIIMIKSNIFPINEIMSKVALKIQTSMNNVEKEKLKIPLGAFTGINLLTGSGPNVKIRISVAGDVETSLKSEFSSQGINQTLHRVYVQVNSKINVLTPFNKIEEKSSNQILIAENVIVGKIPENYINLDKIERINKNN